jgi:RNAse (barnase) inhibitor barstar
VHEHATIHTVRPELVEGSLSWFDTLTTNGVTNTRELHTSANKRGVMSMGENMKPWIRLALKEFWLPFHYRKAGCPGGRDFVWLSIFMALLLTLMLLLLASREGLLNRFVDVLLGNVPGHGVPISVTNNMFSKGGRNAIDSSVLTVVKGLNNDIPGLQIYPYRTLEANLYPLVSLPDEQIWKNKRDDGSKFGPEFNGWAVYSDDPLWDVRSVSTMLPLKIVMSRTLFDTYFDYPHYRQTLQGLLP